MDDRLKKVMNQLFDIDIKTTYHFREFYGFTFVFKKDIAQINDQLTSAEIKPLGIIYKENDDYYFAPLDVTIELDEIIKEYVNKTLKSN